LVQIPKNCEVSETDWVEICGIWISQAHQQITIQIYTDPWKQPCCEIFPPRVEGCTAMILQHSLEEGTPG